MKCHRYFLIIILCLLTFSSAICPSGCIVTTVAPACQLQPSPDRTSKTSASASSPFTSHNMHVHHDGQCLVVGTNARIAQLAACTAWGGTGSTRGLQMNAVARAGQHAWHDDCCPAPALSLSPVGTANIIVASLPHTSSCSTAQQPWSHITVAVVSTGNRPTWLL